MATAILGCAGHQAVKGEPDRDSDGTSPRRPARPPGGARAGAWWPAAWLLVVVAAAGAAEVGSPAPTAAAPADDSGAAIVLLEGLLAKEKGNNPTADELRLKLAYLYDHVGRWDEALKLCERVLAGQPDRGTTRSAMLRKGWILCHAGRLAEAEAALNEVIQRYGDEPRTVRIAKADLAIDVLRAQGHLVEALELTRQAAKGLPATDVLWATLRFREGYLLEGLGAFGEAIGVYQSVPDAAGTDPAFHAYWEARKGLLRCFLAQGRTAERDVVLAELQAAGQIAPDELRLVGLTGTLDRPEPLGPTSPAAEAVDRSQALAWDGRYVDAEAMLRAWLAGNPEHRSRGLVLGQLAALLTGIGRHGEAEAVVAGMVRQEGLTAAMGEVQGAAVLHARRQAASAQDRAERAQQSLLQVLQRTALEPAERYHLLLVLGRAQRWAGESAAAVATLEAAALELPDPALRSQLLLEAARTFLYWVQTSHPRAQ